MVRRAVLANDYGACIAVDWICISVSLCNTDRRASHTVIFCLRVPSLEGLGFRQELNLSFPDFRASCRSSTLLDLTSDHHVPPKSCSGSGQTCSRAASSEADFRSLYTSL
jgi:hypothetical protein